MPSVKGKRIGRIVVFEQIFTGYERLVKISKFIDVADEVITIDRDIARLAGEIRSFFQLERRKPKGPSG